MSDIAATATGIRRSSSWMLALGVLLILCGLVCLSRPLFAGVTLAIFIGWLMLISGVMHLLNAFAASGVGQLLLRVLMSMVYGLAGAWLISSPGEGLAMLTLILGIALIADGVVTLFYSFSLPPFIGKGMLILSAIFGILAGIIIWTKWPQSSALVIGMILGIRLLFAGWSYVWLGLAARKL